MSEKNKEIEAINYDSKRIISLIRTGCMNKGWDLRTLAKKAGISRTTLYLMEQGKTRKPHVGTLNKIAKVLDLDPAEFEKQNTRTSQPVSHLLLDSILGTSQQRSEFDRLSNPMVTLVREKKPELFINWKESDWDELYSQFGTGGQLTEEGVIKVSQQMNEKKEILSQVELLLETHHRETIKTIIESLYKEAKPQSNLVHSEDLTALIESHLKEKR